ncbi:AbrB family transcriptional regulator [Frigidibacter sp. MR17.14]|uniref:AbrB family transcriptional regulator n=1 Tax=Frigidibacter sp. MR17.14 TaxID=3126509 RepID=UPI003012F567
MTPVPSDPPTAPGATRLGRMPVALRWLLLAAMSLVFVVLLEQTGLPAALLLGPMLAGILCGLGGARLVLPGLPYRFAQALVGCMVADSLSLPVLQEIAGRWPLFLGGVVSVIAVAMGLGVLLARARILPGTTALWGASPGGASAMTLMSAQYGADQRLVAVMQYTRVLIVASAAAIIARELGAPAGGSAPGTHWFVLPQAVPFVATMALAVGAVWLSEWIRIPSGPLLLPIFIGTALQDAGFMEIDLPPLMLALGYAAIGWGVGLRFDRPVIAHAARALPRVLAMILVLVAICGGLAALLVRFAGIDPLSAYLATSPGGLDTVAVIAASTKVDVAFVMAMQTARAVIVILFGPWITRIAMRWTGHRG